MPDLITFREWYESVRKPLAEEIGAWRWPFGRYLPDRMAWQTEEIEHFPLLGDEKGIRFELEIDKGIHGLGIKISVGANSAVRFYPGYSVEETSIAKFFAKSPYRERSRQLKFIPYPYGVRKLSPTAYVPPENMFEHEALLCILKGMGTASRQFLEDRIADPGVSEAERDETVLLVEYLRRQKLLKDYVRTM